ncbi:trigger factor [Candidatus Berkelbacteria bacterium]|nr:trigger factor [Candidatus Berkelbacteria bacterium]
MSHDEHHDHVHTVTVKDHKTEKHARHTLTVEVPAHKMAEFFERAYQQLAPTVEIKGFRRGQAPRLMTIQRIGQERYFQHALELALPATYAEALHILDLHPVSSPEISIQGYGEGAPFTYSVTIDVIPDVDPGAYEKITVKAPKADTTVNAKEVNEVLERLRKQQAEVKPVDREAETGDRVEIDYVGMVKNVKRDDLSSQHFPVIIGDGVFRSKKLEESLIGKTKGDAFEVTDKVDKDQVTFQVSVHEVAEVTLPEVDAKFAEQFGRKSADELKDAITTQLGQEKETEARQALETKVLDEVMKKAKLEIPRSLVEEELTRRVDHMKSQLGAMWGKFLEQQKKTEAEIRKDLEPQAEQSVKAGLVLGEIAKREGFGKDRQKGEDDAAFQRRVVRRTINFLVASATGQPTEKPKK